MASKDPRFARLATDPRFLRPSKASHKVVLDDRFKSALEQDEDFGKRGQAKVDKYGRKKGKKNGQNAQLAQLYRLNEARSKGLDRARGEGLVESSSEEEEEEEEEDVESEEDDEGSDDQDRRRRASSEVSIDLDEDGPVASTSAVQVEAAIPAMEDATKRIAIVNLDWDNVRAVDLFKVFDSVLSPSASGISGQAGSRKSKTKIGKGRVEAVRILPSDFGKSRLAREEREGPPVEIFGKNTNGSVLSTSKSSKKKRRAEEDEATDSADDGGEEYDEQALRRYQLERLRYYYAVVEFDTPSAAQHAYEEIDGTEFEATANIFDLRYVPDDTEFNVDEATDVATSSSVDVQAYIPVDFVTDALRNSKVKLTWDADDPQRTKITRNGQLAKAKGKGKSKDAEEEIDYSALLASDSEDDELARSRMRAAFGFSAEGDLEDGDEEDKDQEMEITFTSALSGLAGKDDDAAENDETSLETYQRKERERRAARKAKRLAEKRKELGKSRPTLDELADSDPDEAFDANQFEAEGNEEDGPDAFFDAGEENTTQPQLSKKAAKQLEREQKAKEAEALSLLVDDNDENPGDGKHFDMHAILRAEKITAKPKKSLKKGKDRRKHEEAKVLLEREKDQFEVDLADERFKRLHEDHEFALDPSNPKFMKTKNMQKILDENRKRRDREGPKEKDVSSGPVQPEGDGLLSLVESIKRKSQSSGSNKSKRVKRK